MTKRKKWHMERSKVETYCGRRIDEDMPTQDPSWFENVAQGPVLICTNCWNSRKKERRAALRATF